MNEDLESTKAVESRPRNIPWGIVGGITACVSLAALVYYYSYNKQANTEKSRILKGRRELSEEITPTYEKLRLQVETWAREAAKGPFKGDFIAPEAKTGSARERPTLYVRMRVKDALVAESFVPAMKLSVLDGLASCFLRPTSTGPWPLGEVHFRVYMLGAEFLKDVRDTNNDLRLRNLAYAFDHYKKSDFVKARDALNQAEQVLIALDEDVSSAGTPPEKVDNEYSNRLKATVHPIQVYLYRIVDGKELLRARRIAQLSIVQAEGDKTVSSSTLAIRNAQALGCSTAQDVLSLFDTHTGSLPTIKNAPPPLTLEPSTSLPNVVPSVPPSALLK